MLTKFSIRRPVTMIMVLLIVLLGGTVSLLGLKLDLLPSMNIPVSAIYSTYTGAGPREMETLVTRPLEEALATVPNIDTISSISSDGMSLVILEFTDGTDLDMASLDVRDKVDQIKPILPDDASEPMVIKIDPTMFTQLSIGVTSSRSQSELKSFLEDNVESRMKRIAGVASVDFTGGLDKEIQITMNAEKLAGYNVTESQIMQLLAAENRNYPVGEIRQGDSKLLIRSIGEFATLDEIRDLPITTPTGTVIRLSDVADVREVMKDMASYSVVNGEQSIVMTIQKQSDANTVEVADAVHAELDKISEENPDIQFSTLMDTSDYIKRSVSNVLQTLLIACLLAMVFIFLFLEEVRGSLIIGVSIPASVVATFALMYVSHITFNMISLGGLTIGIGMLVDNSIVVLESVYRHFDRGKTPAEAALDGTREVAASITAGTLTTLCVFVPMIFIKGVVGQIFKDLSLTICYSLASSLIVALTFVPMACAKLLRRNGKHAGEKKMHLIDRIVLAWRHFIGRIQENYRRIMGWALQHKKRVALLSGLIFLLTAASIPFSGVEFIPAMDQGLVNITVEMPPGAQLDETIAMIDQVTAALDGIPEMTKSYAAVGSTGLSSVFVGTDTATVSVELVDKTRRNRSSDEVADEIRSRVKNIAGAKITVASSSEAMGSFGDTGVSILVTGDDTDELKKIGDEMVSLISQVEGTREPTNSAGRSVPEAAVRVDRSKASAYGITSAQIADVINRAVTGNVVTEYKVSGGEIDVRIRQDKQSLEYINDLKNIRLTTAAGAGIPLSEVADITVEDGPVSIDRYNQQRYITVDASIFGRDLNSVQQDITEVLNGYAMPSGYSWEYTGAVTEMQDSISSLMIVLGVALLLVYMVMVAQFQKFLTPFIIMFAVPLALTGGLFGLFATGLPITVSALMGLVMLVGMVVNNAIILIDYTDQLRGQGYSRRDALLESGATRIRPILMTTMTTIFGLLPLAVSNASGTEMVKPLAIVTISGMIFSMYATLIFIPVLYTYIDERRQKRSQKRRKEVLPIIDGNGGMV